MILEYIPLAVAILLLWEFMSIPSPIDYYLRRKSRHSLVKLLEKEGAGLEDVPGSFLPQEMEKDIARIKKARRLKHLSTLDLSEVEK